MFTQLNPTIPVWNTTKNESGYAIGVIDYSQEHHLIWIIVSDSNGEIWAVPNPEVRVQYNYTMGRENE